MNSENEITINNTAYVPKANITNITTIPTTKQIVILNRGWIVVGDVAETDNNIVVNNASVVRVWGTTKGLGELAESGPLSGTKLDKCPNITADKGVVIARMNVNELNWNK